MEINYLNSTPASEAWGYWIALSVLMCAVLAWRGQLAELFRWIVGIYAGVAGLALVAYTIFFRHAPFSIETWSKICLTLTLLGLLRWSVGLLVEYVFGTPPVTINYAHAWLFRVVTLDILPIGVILYLVNIYLQ